MSHKKQARHEVKPQEYALRHVKMPSVRSLREHPYEDHITQDKVYFHMVFAYSLKAVSEVDRLY
jgi:hypothetical protein